MKKRYLFCFPNKMEKLVRFAELTTLFGKIYGLNQKYKEFLEIGEEKWIEKYFKPRMLYEFRQLEKKRNRRRYEKFMIGKGDEVEEDFEKFCEDEEKWIEMKGLTKEEKEEKEEMEQDDGLSSIHYLEESIPKRIGFIVTAPTIDPVDSSVTETKFKPQKIFFPWSEPFCSNTTTCGKMKKVFQVLPFVDLFHQCD